MLQRLDAKFKKKIRNLMNILSLPPPHTHTHLLNAAAIGCIGSSMNYIVCVSVIQELTVSEFAECLRSLGVRYKDMSQSARASDRERERERASERERLLDVCAFVYGLLCFVCTCT